LIGAVGGSAGNLMYPEFVRDKGWRGPEYMKLLRIDLLTGVVAVIVVDLSIWIVAAEHVHGKGLVISGITDVAQMMDSALSSLGPSLLWIGLFFVAFSSFPAYAEGYTKILFRGIYESRPQRKATYGDVATRDPLFKWLQIGVMVIFPLVFSWPGLPGLVV